MTIDLELPLRLAGFAIGLPPDPDPLESYLPDGEDEDGCSYFARFEPNVSVLVCDGVVVSVTSRDQCWFGGIDLIGMEPSAVVEMLGLLVNDVEPGEVSIFNIEGGITLYVRNGIVTQFSLSDFSLIVG